MASTTIISIQATGNSRATAYPIRPSGQLFSVNVSSAPPVGGLASGVLLPSFTFPYVEILLVNADAANPVSVYPLPGGTINGSSSSLSVAASSQVQMWSQSALDWVTLQTSGTGTVTSIATTAPITGGPITGTGTIGLATTGLTLAQYTSPPVVATISGATPLVLGSNNLFVLTLSASATLSFSGPTIGQPIIIYVFQGSSNYSLTFPGAVHWANSPYSAPTMPATAGAFLAAMIRELTSGYYAGHWGGNSAS